MKKKFLIGLLAVFVGILGCVLVLASENALVVHPKGIIAKREFELIVINILLMLVIILPTYALLFWVVWKYCLKKDSPLYDPDHAFGLFGQLTMWALPSLIVLIMALVTWKATHQLNPYNPIESEIKPLSIQVVALDWKWLFIYPDQRIATLNELYIPEKTPVHLKLTADGSPMNSFWVPQLSGQIYAMTGMTTQLHFIADAPGKFAGRAVEINGEGYSGMTFVVKSVSSAEFEEWVAGVKKSPLHLTEERYLEILKPNIDRSVTLFSEVDENLYHEIVHKYMYPAKPLL